ncbi:TPA: ATP-dependent helicase [Pseudomonas aeruginosa]|uniref:ATP-dependent helicase n=1 Tax=Pseudomonas aeruginosa TaxID=287 RepID=UPI000744684D|nr:ATP-dependent helicase [Pseudomonas aeruginosa]ALY60536.1 ATP-dependent DNA helicase Rep [Pseudomonas aeruginosa]MCS7782469.1 ATP-dependent helicase [Pseudomonas aeruginosa]RPZ79228.1 ATP-dependent helicase [Pseudomonas aeruginosa]RUH19596.1 ATP-dependent helicase [Pseudomonas aeruginosa]RUH53237.1 ATP-dependent helicase [Pseudomonas aeruginosa]
MSTAKPAYLTAAEDLRGNEDQWRAYESTGNCVILAGPGSGKTKTITVKIARLLAEIVRRPQRIACITYSNACIGELRSRLTKLGIEDGNRTLISTVHSFCLTELVLPYAAMGSLAVPIPLAVATPAESRKLFIAAYRSVYGEAPRSSSSRTSFDKLRRTIPDRNSAEWLAWNKRETRVVEAYEDLLLTRGLIDFDGIVLAGLELIEKHGWVRQAIRAKYPAVVIDEYQDLGLPLHRIVRALLDAGVRIIAVGDPDQSIYGFTGANPALLKTLAQDQRIEAITLRMNYRCADRIIAASRSLFPDRAEFQSHDDRQGDIRIHKLERDLLGQAKYAFETLIPALLDANPTWKPGDIALLYRSMAEGKQIALAADRLQIRYFRLDNGSPIKRTRLTEWLTEAAQWCAGGWKTGQVQLSQLLKSWQRMQRSGKSEAQLLASRKRLIAALFSLRDGSLTLRSWLKSLDSAILGDMLRSEPGLSDEIDILADLINEADTGGALEQFTVEIFGNQGKSPDQINLMTLHSSKGLEFQAVIMLGLEKGALPSSYDRTPEQVQESTRLFYVGVTRAKSQVHLTFNTDESPLLTTIRTAT